MIEPAAWDMFDQTMKNRSRQADETRERDALLFTLLMLVREKCLTGTYVRGRKLETSTGPR